MQLYLFKLLALEESVNFVAEKSNLNLKTTEKYLPFCPRVAEKERYSEFIRSLVILKYV